MQMLMPLKKLLLSAALIAFATSCAKAQSSTPVIPIPPAHPTQTLVLIVLPGQTALKWVAIDGMSIQYDAANNYLKAVVNTVIETVVPFTPLGVVDGTNVTFTFPLSSDTPIPGSLEVYLNGARLSPTNDFTQPDGHTIVFRVAPTLNSIILASYRR